MIQKSLFSLFFFMVIMISGLSEKSFAASAELNYKVYCWQCHGMKGNGKGVNIRDMAVQPRAHTDAKGMKSLSDASMFKAIKEGGLAVSKSVLMPPWGHTFTDEEIHDLVKYLRKLCQCKPGS